MKAQNCKKLLNQNSNTSAERLNSFFLQNTIKTMPGIYSCAIDSFIEMFYRCIYPQVMRSSLSQNDMSRFLDLIMNACEHYQHLESRYQSSEMSLPHTELTINVRNPIWDYVIANCSSFRNRDCNAQFSQIFQENVFNFSNDLDRALFVSSYQYNEYCSQCESQSEGTVFGFIQYVSPINLNNNFDIMNIGTNWPEMLLSQNLFVQNVNCHVCRSSLQASNLYAIPSVVLFIEFAPMIMDFVEIFDEFAVQGLVYYLHAVVRNPGGHFSVAIKKSNLNWLYIDDLANSIKVYRSFREIQNIYPNGWFFCCYIQENELSITLPNCDSHVNSCATSSNCSDVNNVTFLEHSYSTPEKLVNNVVTDHDYSSKKKKFISNSHFLFEHNYSEDLKHDDYNYIHFDVTSSKPIDFAKENKSDLNKKRKIENPGLRKNYKSRKCNNEENVTDALNTPLNHTSNSFHLTEISCFDTCQTINSDSIEMIKNFYKDMDKLELHQCQVCKEVWCKIYNSTCNRCKRDKSFPKKFSIENEMVPSPVPEALKNLTQVEEMLIARALPIMNVYCKPKGGQRAYKGHVITFPNNVQKVVNILPNLPGDLPLIKIKKKDSANSKDFRVQKAKVLAALNWLAHNNPVYKDIEIDQDRIDMLPVDDELDSITSISIEKDNASTVDMDTCDLVDDDVPVDLGPNIDESNTPEELSSFVPMQNNSKTQKQILEEFPSSTELDIIGDDAINEYNTPFLATMAFPTLFPDSKGDPTNNALLRNISSNDLDSFASKVRHLLKFGEKKEGKWYYRFAAHPRFAYWAFNMLYRKRILSKGNLYVKRNPGQSDFTLEEFNAMMYRETSGTLMNKIFYYSKEITGSCSYWNKIRQDLKTIVKQVGVPTIFFTFSMAEYHWPDFLKLFDVENSTDLQVRKLISENPHIVDWYFTERTDKFVKNWLYDYLKASWHWYRFEYASRGSIHCHGLAKLSDDPGLVDLTAIALKGFLSEEKIRLRNDLQQNEILQMHRDIEAGKLAGKQVCTYIDTLVTAINPVQGDYWSKPKTHPCKVNFENIQDYDSDYANLVNSVQKHICNSAYCLRKIGDKTVCRFNFPQECADNTSINFVKVNTRDGSLRYKAEIKFKRNDPRVNRHQRVQLQGWRANADINVVIDYHSCVEYLTKYASKPEKLSSVAQDAFSHVAKKVNEAHFDPVSTIKRLMMRAVGLRDMSIQEVCHQILQLKLYSSSYEVIATSLEGSRKIESEGGELRSKPSLLDIYANREDYSTDTQVIQCNFLFFHSNYFLKDKKLCKRKKVVVVRTSPNYPSSPKGVHYAKYCKYNLLRYKTWFRHPNSAWGNIDVEDDTEYITQWAMFLQSEEAKFIVPNYLRELEITEQYISNDISSDDESDEDIPNKEEWMYLADFLNSQNTSDVDEDSGNNIVYWQTQCESFDMNSRLEMPTWINTKKASFEIGKSYNDTATEETYISQLNHEQSKVFGIISSHNHELSPQLLLIITGKAGCGKSFVIDRIRNLLRSKCIVSAMFGIAAFNVSGKTLHHLLKLPIKGKRNCELKGPALFELQENLQDIHYIVIDEFSVVGQKELAWINRRCKQAKGKFDVPFGGINIILVGDLGQLPPVNGKVIFSSKASNELEMEGLFVYNQFLSVVELSVNERAKGSDESQLKFRRLLGNIRDGKVTIDDWKLLLTRSANEKTKSELKNAVKLSHSNKDVAENNFNALHSLGSPIATIPALHNKKAAAKCSSDDMGGLDPKLLISVGARVMLTRNLWTDAGLCNGATGLVKNVIYNDLDSSSFPIAILVKFDNYVGPSFLEDEANVVPIPPCSSCSESLGTDYERTQFPLRLAWAMTIHKSQGLTLTQSWVDLGKSERSIGLSYVALSRVRNLQSMIIEPMPFERLNCLKDKNLIIARLEEEKRLHQLSKLL